MASTRIWAARDTGVAPLNIAPLPCRGMHVPIVCPSHTRRDARSPPRHPRGRLVIGTCLAFVVGPLMLHVVVPLAASLLGLFRWTRLSEGKTS